MLSVFLRYTDSDNVSTFRHTTIYNKQVLPILCWAFGLLAAKYFYIIWLSTVLIMNVPYIWNWWILWYRYPSGAPEFTPFFYGLRASFRSTWVHTIFLWAPCFPIFSVCVVFCWLISAFYLLFPQAIDCITCPFSTYNFSLVLYLISVYLSLSSCVRRNGIHRRYSYLWMTVSILQHT